MRRLAEQTILRVDITVISVACFVSVILYTSAFYVEFSSAMWNGILVFFTLLSFVAILIAGAFVIHNRLNHLPKRLGDIYTFVLLGTSVSGTIMIFLLTIEVRDVGPMFWEFWLFWVGAIQLNQLLFFIAIKLLFYKRLLSVIEQKWRPKTILYLLMIIIVVIVEGAILLAWGHVFWLLGEKVVLVW